MNVINISLYVRCKILVKIYCTVLLLTAEAFADARKAPFLDLLVAVVIGII